MIKKLISFIIYLGLLGLMIYWIINQNHEISDNIRFSDFNYYYLLIFIVLLFFSNTTRSLRTSYLFNPKSVIPQSSIFWIIFTSIPLSILLGGGGVFFRIYFLKKREKVSYVTSSSAMFVEKLLDLIIVFSTLIITALYLPQLEFINPLRFNQSNTLNQQFDQIDLDNLKFIPYTFLIILGISVVVYLKKYFFRLLLLIAGEFPKNTYWKIKKKIITLDQGLRFFQKPTKLIIYLIFTMVIWLIETSMCYVIFSSLGIPITFLESLLVNIFNVIFLLLPLAPAGIGVIQAAFILSGKVLEIPYNMLTISFYFHFFLLASNAVLLMIGSHRLNLTFGGLRKLLLKSKVD